LFDSAAKIVAEVEKGHEHAGTISEYLSILPYDTRFRSYQHIRTRRMSEVARTSQDSHHFTTDGR
jgi:hypothetical protein